MTQEQQLARLLTCAIYQLGGSLEVSRELLDTMLPVRLVLDVDTDPLVVKMSIMAQEILIGTVDNEEVTVVL